MVNKSVREMPLGMKKMLMEHIISHFLHITFTDAATKEMRERIAGKILGRGIEIDPAYIPALTFNALDMAMLGEFFKDLGYEEFPTVVDVNPIREASKVLPLVTGDNKVPGLNYDIPVYMNAGAKGAQGALVLALNTFKAIKEAQIDLSGSGAFDNVVEVLKEKSLYSKMTDQSVEEFMKIYEKYNQLLKTEGLITFADQEPIGISLMDLHPDYLNGLGFWHVVIDEFQDSNDINMEFVRRLQACRDIHGGTIKSILVIGDSDQSIYGFRNAVVENITSFDRKLGEPVEHFALVNNYRSYAPIIDLANNFVAKNENRKVKQLIAARGAGGVVSIKGYPDWETELQWVTEKYKEVKESHPDWTIGVMTRNKKGLANISQAFSREDIEWTMMAAIRYMENTRVQAAMSLFECFGDPDATQGYYDYLNVLHDNHFKDFPKDERSAMQDNLRNQIIAIKSQKPFLQRQKMHDLLDDLDKDDELYIMWKDMIYQEAMSKCQKEGSFLREPYYLNEAIKNFRLFGDRAEAKLTRSYEGAALITSHSSKGLEYDCVFLLLDDFDNINYHKGAKSALDVEEQRRLLFVAMTRAKQELYVTGSYVAYSNERDGDTYNQFLRELYEVRDGDTKVWEAECLAYRQELSRKLQERRQERNRVQKAKRDARKADVLSDLLTKKNKAGSSADKTAKKKAS